MTHPHMIYMFDCHSVAACSSINSSRGDSMAWFSEFGGCDQAMTVVVTQTMHLDVRFQYIYIYSQVQGQSKTLEVPNTETDAQTRSQSLEQTPKRPVNDRNVTATLPRLVRTHIPLYYTILYQVVVPTRSSWLL